jgi:orotate phosphoribosyltransferase
MMHQPIIDSLFATKAILVCDPDHPFWYTSGTLGPFYINTHFLYRSELDASELLLMIEEGAASDRLYFPHFLIENLKIMYDTSDVFRSVTDQIVEKAKTINFDFISGGERRDFFFSLLPAYLMKKPHLSIFKDMQAVLTDGDFAQTIPVYEASITGKRALHISDLVTEASSYTRAWIPVIREFGAVIEDTITIIDRNQGGATALMAEGVRLHSFETVDIHLFERARDIGEITDEQLSSVTSFMQNPKGFMKNFLDTHPHYIEEQIALGGKPRERAEIAISKGYASSPGCSLPS